MLLGAGTYGQVVAKEGKAVKKFAKLSHLVQEYAALRYIQDCRYVVHPEGVDFTNLELQMELYDCSLRKWMQDKNEVTPVMLQDIIRGLVELHDRKLAHGDLKPGNILVRKDPIKVVLGDCGFVSIAKYAKVNCTAAMYRDPVIIYDTKHDMYSLGIILLEIFSKKGIEGNMNYRKLNEIIEQRIDHKGWRRTILSLVNEDRNKRPTARELLYELYKENPSKWSYTHVKIGRSTRAGRVVITAVNESQRDEMRTLIKTITNRYDLSRSKKGYGALLGYLERHHVDHREHIKYAVVTMFIVSTLFSKNRFHLRRVLSHYKNELPMHELHNVLQRLLSDHTFLCVLMHP
jgi:serine/threonine protein kinase